jgi:hypothetical protein
MPKTILFAICGLVVLSACKKRDNTPPAPKNDQTTQATTHRPSSPKFDACEFITKQEIEAIEGSPVIDTKSSGQADGGLSIGQCFYTTKEFSRSVSLSVTKTDQDASAKRSVKEYWDGMFAKYEKEDNEREQEKEPEGDKEKKESLRKQRGEREEEGESVPPKKISGVGDEAFWLGNRVGGALYVVKKDVILRVSVGGPDPEQGKIDKCKALAEKALARL